MIFFARLAFLFNIGFLFALLIRIFPSLFGLAMQQGTSETGMVVGMILIWYYISVPVNILFMVTVSAGKLLKIKIFL